MFHFEELTMKMLLCATVATLATILWNNHAVGQEIPDSARKELARFVAMWEIEDAVDGEAIKSTIDAKWNDDRTAVTYTWRGTNPDTNKPASSTGVIGWDGSRKVLVEFAVSSSGEVFTSTFHPAEGEWRCPTEGTELVEGKFKPFKTVRIFKWNPSGFDIIGTEKTLDGEARPDTTAALRRVK
jgi:hypothetical protein